MAITRLLRRLLFTTCITHPTPLLRRPLLSTNIVRLDRFTSTDSAASKNRSKSPLGFHSIYGDWDLTRTAMSSPGLDYEHWKVVMYDPPAGRGAPNEQIIDFYIKTLAKVVGSEEEAKKRIYKTYFGRMLTTFGCQLDWETAYKLEELPEVRYIIPDSYDDPETKDYGGELIVDGKIVQRSTE